MSPTGELTAALVVAGEIMLGTLVLMGLVWLINRHERGKQAPPSRPERPRALVVPIHAAPVLRAGSNPPPTFPKPAPPPDPPRPPFP